MNLLLLAFASQSAESLNAPLKRATACASVETEGHHVEALSLPKNWDQCFKPVETMLDHPWDAIVLFSEKQCEAIAVERISINEADVSLKDETGRRPRGKVLAVDGDPGYWTTLPYRDLCQELSAAHFPTTSSHSAGTGLENCVSYLLAHGLSKRGKSIPAGLIQFPTASPVFTEEDAKRFLSILLRTLDPARQSGDRLGFNANALEKRFKGEVRSKIEQQSF